MPQSLVDIFCPPGERIHKIGGRRVTGVTDTDAAALGMFDTRVGSGEQIWIHANVSWNELEDITNGHVFSSGGAPNMFSMLAQYPLLVERLKVNPGEVCPFTLEDMAEAARRGPTNPPIRWVYHDPVIELWRAAAGKLEGVVDEEFRQNPLKMRFLPDVSNIGQTDAYKQKGIAVPLWVLEATSVVPNERQKPLRLEAQDVPFVEGWDPFLILAGVNFASPSYNMLVFVGGRTPSTFAAELLAIGKDSISGQELEDAKTRAEMQGVKLLSYLQLPSEIHVVKGVGTFAEETFKELRVGLSSRYGTGFKGSYLNVAIVGLAYVSRGVPLRVSGPLDVRFYNKI